MNAIKDYFAGQYYRKILTKHPFLHRAVRFSDAKYFCVIANPYSQEEAEDIENLIVNLLRERKRTKVFQFSLEKKNKILLRPVFDVTLVPASHLRWFSAPDERTIENFLLHSFDVCIDLVNSDSLYSKFLCGVSHAGMRVGFYAEGNEKFYDMIINPVGKRSLREKIADVMTYLQMVK